MGVEWPVLDVERDEVVYSVLARVAVHDQPMDKERIAARLLDGAMDHLLDRARFRQALAAKADGASPAPAFVSATLPHCPPGPKVAASADDLLGRVVVVKTHDGFGSGFFVSPEGLVLTAAHVVESNRMTLRLHDGTEVSAIPVRVVPQKDVALLRTEKALTGQARHASRFVPTRPSRDRRCTPWARPRAWPSPSPSRVAS
jgi:S1-C subfamily serine protease